MKNIYTILVDITLQLNYAYLTYPDSATKKYGPVVNESVTNCHDLMLASSLKNADNIVQVSFSGMCIQRL